EAPRRISRRGSPSAPVCDGPYSTITSTLLFALATKSVRRGKAPSECTGGLGSAESELCRCFLECLIDSFNFFVVRWGGGLQLHSDDEAKIETHSRRLNLGD